MDASAPPFNDKDTPVRSSAATANASASPVANVDLSDSPTAPYASLVEDAYKEPPAVILHVHPPHHQRPQVPQLALASQHAPGTAISEWEIGLFDCVLAPAHCCMAAFFPCVNGAYAAHYIGWSGAVAGIFFFIVYTGDYLFAAYGGSFGEWFAASAVCSLLFFLGVFLLRRSVREFYRIQGSCITDCCCSFWCSCCVMAQMSAHTERAKKKRENEIATLPAYEAA